MSAIPEDLVRKYGLEPLPESVMRLTKLVSSQDANLDEITRVIEKDKGLSAKLLRAANPGVDSPEFYDITSVDQALMRSGMGCVLLLAMGEPLQRAVIKMCQTMLGIKAETVPHETIEMEGEHLLGEVGFSGKATGQVDIRVAEPTAVFMTASILGLPKDSVPDPAEVNDVVGEIVNIVAGNFKSNLTDAGLDCKLVAPIIHRSTSLDHIRKPGQLWERLGYRSPELSMLVDLSVNPWDY